MCKRRNQCLTIAWWRTWIFSNGFYEMSLQGFPLMKRGSRSFSNFQISERPDTSNVFVFVRTIFPKNNLKKKYKSLRMKFSKDNSKGEHLMLFEIFFHLMPRFTLSFMNFLLKNFIFPTAPIRWTLEVEEETMESLSLELFYLRLTSILFPTDIPKDKQTQ